MNTSFYNQTIFSSPTHQETTDQYNSYFSSFHHIESSLLNFDNNTIKMESNFYPSPSESPLPSEMMLVTPHHHPEQYQFLDTMMMVPPLGQYESFDIPAMDTFTSMLIPEFYEHKAPEIALVDQFIAQHQAALEDKKQKQPCQETSWSHWTSSSSSRDSTPEIVSDAVSINEVPSVPSSPISEPEVVITSKNKKTNKVTKGTGTTRRGRGKGVKNSVANKKAMTAAAVAAASTTVMESTFTSSKTPMEGALYVCQHHECGRSFTRPYNLTSHMRVHTCDRPYACSQCGRKFARQHDRNRHEKLHWGIRPYACQHCHKSFARMDALNRHLRMENGCTGLHL